MNPLFSISKVPKDNQRTFLSAKESENLPKKAYPLLSRRVWGTKGRCSPQLLLRSSDRSGNLLQKLKNTAQ